MLQLNFSLKFSKKMSAANLKFAVIKLVVVVSGCVCFINPDLRPNADGLKIWERGAISFEVKETFAMAVLRADRESVARGIIRRVFDFSIGTIQTKTCSETGSRSSYSGPTAILAGVPFDGRTI